MSGDCTCATCAIGKMSPEEFRQALRMTVRDELREIGLPIDTPEERSNALLDFTFIRGLRTTMQATATKVGYSVMAAALALIAAAGGAALTYLKAKGG